jgi:phosphoribosylglycinamide formyltransferase-1
LNELCNLIVDLADPRIDRQAPAGIESLESAGCDERTLAWIDETFGGAWSSEARAGETIVARGDSGPVGFATIDARGLTYSWLGGLAREPGVGLFGPFGVAPQDRDSGLGGALLHYALAALRKRGYARALIAAVGDSSLAHYYGECVGARVAERFDRKALLRPKRRTLVMASGNGSNFQAVLDAVADGTLPLEIVALVSSNPRAYAIERAHKADVPAVVVAWDRRNEHREAFDERLLQAVESESPDLILLLGWMHLLPVSFVRAFPELLNLHPAFLPLDPQRDHVVMPDGTAIPAFRGPRAVRDALAVSNPWVGATQHRVTADTDRGPVMARKPLRVRDGESEEELMERVHEIERGVVRAGVTRWLYEQPEPTAD